MRTWLISEASSLGSSTSSYAARSATVTALSVLTVVVGSMAASTCSAASCGVFGSVRRQRAAAARAGCRGRSCDGSRPVPGSTRSTGRCRCGSRRSRRACRARPAGPCPHRRSRPAGCGCPRSARSSSELSAAAHAGELGDAEIGLLDDRARQAVHLGLLHVDQQLLGRPRRQLRSALAVTATRPVPEQRERRRPTGRASAGPDGNGRSAWRHSGRCAAVRTLSTIAGHATLGPCGCCWSTTRSGWSPRCAAGLTAEGFVVESARRRGARAGAGPDRGLRRRGARRDAARAVRLRGGAPAAGRGELGAGADAVGQGRRVRPGRRAGRRRRRLPDQAVLLRRPGGPDPGPAAARGGGPAGGAGRGGHHPGSGQPRGQGRPASRSS